VGADRARGRTVRRIEGARQAGARRGGRPLIEVADNRAERRYEGRIDGKLAGSIHYVEHEGQLALVHTEVEPGFEGQGVGGRLVAATLDDIREHGLTIVVRCPFVRAYLEKHPEYADLVAGQPD
jgi:predicted GNAT family acetyltransferase